MLAAASAESQEWRPFDEKDMQTRILIRQKILELLCSNVPEGQQRNRCRDDKFTEASESCYKAPHDDEVPIHFLCVDVKLEIKFWEFLNATSPDATLQVVPKRCSGDSAQKIYNWDMYCGAANGAPLDCLEGHNRLERQYGCRM
jgi:hypothetical protein